MLPPPPGVRGSTKTRPGGGAEVLMGCRPCPLTGTHLVRSFGKGCEVVLALRDVSLALGEGEVVLVIGPSGSGKTSLLATLSGLLRPDGGQVVALGQDLWRMSDREREAFRLGHCGFIFQDHLLLPALNAQDQLDMMLRWGTHMPRARRRVEVAAMLELLGLAKKGRLRAGQLSGGEMQRVAIGRALIKRPRFIFADEPTGALDWGNGRQAVELLRAAAHGRGATVFMVTHDSRIAPYADRVISMEDGRCREVLTPG